MITPSLSLTATERVLPRMALDFTTALLDPRVTVSRALNTATRVNSSGLIETVNANLPRFDYSVTSIGVCQGLLIEETRANLFQRSAEFNDPYWSTINGSIVATDVEVAPDGTTTADTFTASSSNCYLFASSSVPSAGTYTLSIFVKPNGSTFFGLYMGVGGGSATFTLTGNGSVSSGTGTIRLFPNGWYRCSMTGTTGGSANSGVFISPSVNGSSWFVWGAQLEAGAFATSYIPTTTTSLTRNADVVNMTGTNFSSWYSSSSAALAAVVIPSIATGTRPIWQLDDTTANEIIALRGNVANPELYIVDNGTPQAQLDAGTITANTQYGLCAAFTANSCAASQNGATPVTTATATMPTVTQARIGSDGSNFLNGVVRTLRYWPQRILNAETQAFSK